MPSTPTITWTELLVSRAGGSNSRDLIYKAVGSDEDTDITADVAAQLGVGLPASHDGLPFQEISDLRYHGDETWEVTLRYGTSGEGAVIAEDQQLLSFSTAGGIQRIQHSLATVNSYVPVGATEQDFGGAIGVNADNSVEGVDVPVPIFTFAIRKRVSSATIAASSGDYIGDLYRATGKMNDAIWSVTASDVTLSFAAGEVRFDGVDAPERDSDGTWLLTFHFSASPNVADLAIGDITVEAKAGWDYLWIYYRPALSGDSKAILPTPVQANVERVLYTADFSTLGLT